MTMYADEAALRRAFAPARALEPTDAEVASVLARAHASARPRRLRVLARAAEPARRRRRRPARSPRWLRPAAVGAVFLALLLSTGYAAAPPLRAAIDDVAGSLGGWLSGAPGEAPGRPLRQDEQAPSYFRDPRFARGPRVIAEADGYKLYAAREPHGDGVEFDLGDTGVGLGEVSAGVFRNHLLFVLGPGAMRNADERGHVPLFGITARSVDSVELTYASGPPLRVGRLSGGFVLLAEPVRRPHEVIAFDAGGREVGRALVDDSNHPGPRIDWSQYGPPAPRIPARCQPGAVGLDPPPSCPNATRGP